MSRPSVFLDPALALAARGLRVFPVTPKQKKPLIKEWQILATTDPEQIQKWWKQWLNANVGIATGEESNLLVLDVDVDADKDLDGNETLDQLEQRYAGLPPTIEVLTPRGGRHLYFQYPKGQDIRNSAGALGEGLDIRGEGGYVVAPPSVLLSGRPYAWDVDHPPDETVLGEIPEWVLTVVREQKPKAAESLAMNENGYILEGQRNVTLTSLAGKMRRAGMDAEEIDAGLQVINKRRGKPPLDAEEIRNIAASVSRYEPGRTDEGSQATLVDRGKQDEMPFMSYKEGGVHETNFCPLTALQFVESIEEEEIEWVLEGYLAKGSLVTWVAKPKTGKTTLAYQMARAVADGRTFLGRATQKGGVLILAVEEHQRDVKLRLQDLECDAFQNLFIHCQPTDPTPAFFHELKAFIKAKQIVLVVIDTLASFWKLKDENDAAAMTQAIKPLLQLARESGACVLMIHHSRKSEGAYGDEIRGSSALFGLVDVAVMMRNAEVKTQRKLIALSRYPETPTELIIEFRDGEYVSLGDPDEVSRKARLQKMRDALSDTPEKADVIIKRAGLKHRAGQRLLTWLADHNEALKTGAGKKGDPFLYAKGNSFHAGSPSYKTRNELENPDSIHAGGTGGCTNDNELNKESEEVTVYVDATD